VIVYRDVDYDEKNVFRTFDLARIREFQRLVDKKPLGHLKLVESLSLNFSNWTPPSSSIAILAKKSMPQPPLATLLVSIVVEEHFEQRSGSISYYCKNTRLEHFFETPKFKGGRTEQTIHLTKHTSDQGQSREDEVVSLKLL
jgi:hypothetical protein